jgi:hypothetical protein
MKSILALVLAVALFAAPLAIAGGLSSSDSGFLFNGNQVSATAISDQEMQTTQGSSLTANLLNFSNILNNPKTDVNVSDNNTNICFVFAGCGIKVGS